MRYVPRVVIVTIVLLALADVASAKEWHGIVPLHSTRKDVIRLLGNPSDAGGRANYSLENEDVYFVFSNEEFNQECVRKLPPGTVLLIQIRPKKEVTLSELHLEENQFRKFDPGSGLWPGMEGYISDDDGLVLRAEHGKVREICYIATLKDKQLCPEYYEYPEEIVRVGAPHIRQFDEWSDIPFEDERERLDNAFIYLEQQPNNILYLIIYAGKTACVGEAKARGLRAKDYLVYSRGAKPDAIVWVDGGYQMLPRTQVWILPSDVPEPVATSEGSLKASEVRIERNCKIRYRGGSR